MYEQISKIYDYFQHATLPKCIASMSGYHKLSGRSSILSSTLWSASLLTCKTTWASEVSFGLQLDWFMLDIVGDFCSLRTLSLYQMIVPTKIVTMRFILAVIAAIASE